MTQSFSYAGSSAQIVFGDGARSQLADWVRKVGCSRALVLSTPQQKADAEALAQDIGDLAAGVFSGATMHTPVDVTEAAMKLVAEAEADCVVSFGGGSTTGLGKAIAYRTDLPQIVMPTTYAGSEVTPILGQTEAGSKTTVRDAKILPEVVIYDPALTLGLPVAMSVTSGLNAMAHAVEGLYAKDRNPISTLMALEGLRAFSRSLRKIVASPQDAEARGDALYGAWLCGTVLGTVGMALHHKLCHTLGGSFDTPHAETHAIMLPHTAAFNAAAAAPELAAAAEIFGGSIGSGLWDFATAIGAPLSLKELGLSEADLDRAASIAVENSYWNPRPVDRSSIRALLQDAFEGRRPQD
ncbi:maleylacetate reductase [Xaviernesmea oryzae]|uniref:Maleylacetate reductase n=1 Tax=Xaviernesmea oryzae TaxID=464029 RepID=A0A1Q9AYR9_9HYPH|nr:maleylacetate reductase [Xaviernesmea oryzae]OLP60589.1 maleylacetate reductase [Xaviernesmea oryzae]SEM31912.1 maleylacetate reductase [Xaviernesmea oryzae]